MMMLWLLELTIPQLEQEDFPKLSRSFPD